MIRIPELWAQRKARRARINAELAAADAAERMAWVQRVTYGIHEMYYDGEGRDGWTSEPVSVTGCSVDDLRVELDRMLTALEMDVIVDDQP